MDRPGAPPRPPSRRRRAARGLRPFLPIDRNLTQRKRLLTHRARRTLELLRKLRPQHPRLREAPEAPHILARPFAARVVANRLSQASSW
jgi:hypothetical protein